MDIEDLKKYRLGGFYKHNPSDQIWWTKAEGLKGPVLFSFDRKTIFNYWPDYPDKLTAEQKEIFDREYAEWAKFYRGELLPDCDDEEDEEE